MSPGGAVVLVMVIVGNVVSFAGIWGGDGIRAGETVGGLMGPMFSSGNMMAVRAGIVRFVTFGGF